MTIKKRKNVFVKNYWAIDSSVPKQMFKKKAMWQRCSLCRRYI